MKKKCALLLLLTVFVCTCGCGAAARGRRPDVLTCLIAGHDTAAANTDVLAIAAYDLAADAVTVLQIPRDTYFHSGFHQNKINQIYPALYEAAQQPGARQAAMHRLTETVSQAMGVRLDGYISVTYEDVAKAVDVVGGVEMELPADFTFTHPVTGGQVTLQAGTRKLDGISSVAYLRHRAGYANGDLDRLEVHKRFLAAYFRAARTAMSPGRAVTLIRRFSDSPVTDLPLSRRLRVCWHYFTHTGTPRLSIMTLSGRAVREKGDAGLWYYATCRAGAQAQTALFPRCGDFDPQYLFRDPECPFIRKVYDAPAAEDGAPLLPEDAPKP